MSQQPQRKPEDINDVLYDMCRDLVRNGHRMDGSTKKRQFRTIWMVWENRQAKGEKLPEPVFHTHYGTVGTPEAHAWLMDIMDELMRRHKNGAGWGWLGTV